MKRYLSFALASLMLILSLTACGKKAPAEVTASAADLAKQLSETVSDGTLSSEPVVSDILASTYFVDMDQVEESAAYMSTGATACEVAVIKCTDSSYTTEVEDLFKSRVESQSELFASYAPDEVKKLDAAIIRVSGNYVVLCVTDDASKAESVLKDAGF